MSEVVEAINTQDTPKPHVDPFPPVWLSIVWILVYFFLQIACLMAAIILTVSSDPKFAQAMQGDQAAAMTSPQFGVMVLWSIIISGAITLALLWWNLRKDDRPAKIGLFAPSSLGLGKTLGIGAALILGASALNFVYATYIIPGVEMQDAIKALLASVPKDPLNTAVKYLAVAVMAPVIEEVLFRGYLQNALKNHFSPHVAIWGAALIFAMVHMQPAAFPALVVLGAAFGYLYYLTGSLKANIGLHVVNNAAALAFAGM